MARITCAWELGGGLGHITRLATLGNALEKRGYTIAFILKNKKQVKHFLAKKNADIFQAPRWNGYNQNLPKPIANYTEILIHRGYVEPGVLRMLCEQWRDLFLKTKPDLIIADHSPTAILAAYTLGIKCISFGNGFASPPRVSPFPVFRNEYMNNHQRFINEERQVLDSINTVIKKFDCKPLNKLADLFQTLDFDIIDTFPEMDPYQERTDAYYVGNVCLHGKNVDYTENWFKSNRKKVFVYLKSNYKNLEHTLSGISNIDAEKLVYAGDISVNLKKQFQMDSMFFSENPVNVSQVLKECDAVICNAGHGLVLESLLAGIPLILMPIVYEHTLTAMQVEAIGAGMTVYPDNQNCGITLQRVFSDERFKYNAMKFSQKYKKYSAEYSLEKVISKCEKHIIPRN